MAKEVINLCPEKNVYASDDARHISDRQQESVNFERTPLLDPSLIWVIPPQENFATTMLIRGEERVSRRIWMAGFNENGEIKSVRSVGVSSLRAMGFGLVKDGVAAPAISTTLNEEGNVRAASGTNYVHAMEDTSWIKGENHLYVVKQGVAIRPAGSNEVYQAAFENGKMQANEDGTLKLTTTNMKFFVREDDPTVEQVEKAKEAIKGAVKEQFYAL